VPGQKQSRLAHLVRSECEKGARPAGDQGCAVQVGGEQATSFWLSLFVCRQLGVSHRRKQQAACFPWNRSMACPTSGSSKVLVSPGTDRWRVPPAAAASCLFSLEQIHGMSHRRQQQAMAAASGVCQQTSPNYDELVTP